MKFYIGDIFGGSHGYYVLSHIIKAEDNDPNPIFIFEECTILKVEKDKSRKICSYKEIFKNFDSFTHNLSYNDTVQQIYCREREFLIEKYNIFSTLKNKEKSSKI